MSRILNRRVLFSALLPAALGADCVTNEQSIFIRQVNIPPEGSTTCVVEADPTSLHLGYGTLDVALRSSYQADLLVGNQLMARGSRQQVRDETSRVMLEGAEVTTTDDRTGAIVFGPVTSYGSGFVDPSSDTTPGWGLLAATLFGPNQSSGASDLVTTLRSAPYGTMRNVTAHVRAFGHTLGGTSVQTGDFLFPITLCNGCLVSFAADANDTTVMPNPNCDLPAATGTVLTAPCMVGQDDTVDCRVCRQYLGAAEVCEPYRNQ